MRNDVQHFSVNQKVFTQVFQKKSKTCIKGDTFLQNVDVICFLFPNTLFLRVDIAGSEITHNAFIIFGCSKHRITIFGIVSTPTLAVKLKSKRIVAIFARFFSAQASKTENIE